MFRIRSCGGLHRRLLLQSVLSLNRSHTRDHALFTVCVWFFLSRFRREALPVAKKRARMSFSFVATSSARHGQPICFAYQPACSLQVVLCVKIGERLQLSKQELSARKALARTSPKLPVGTEKAGAWRARKMPTPTKCG